MVEDEEGLILYLHEKGLTPGTCVTVLAQESKDAPQQSENVKLRVEDRELSISKASAPKIWVTL